MPAAKNQFVKGGGSREACLEIFLESRKANFCEMGVVKKEG